MKYKAWIIGGVGAVLVGLLVAWWLYTFERVEKEVSVPPRGEASYNPLFALQKTLEARGLRAESHATLALTALDLKPGDTVIYSADPRAMTRQQVDALLTWVDSGGRLAFAIPASAEGRPGDLMDDLGLTVRESRDCLEWPAGSGAGTGEPKTDDEKADGKKGRWCTRHRFQVHPEYWGDYAWLWGNDTQGYLMGRQSFGAGRLFVAANLSFLHNRHLNEGGNAAFAWQVLGPLLGEGQVHLIYASDVPPWYVYLVRQGWPVLLPLVLALLAWLWARNERLGPVLPLAAAHQRALLMHVRAAGEFAFRRGRGGALYAVVRRGFFERLRRREPLLAALDEENLIVALAERHRLPQADIRQALRPMDLTRPEVFFATIRTLTLLRNQT
ncbi:DUF4350 domain-containing protein [Tahibacter amnicola]|uniref:DUF4350 domain-containing protein n=1 Tax=Tahibacter amnicola TaxID=2976241 RepID=A0ABY6BDC2_9GAMM|nr:DUF4350 domain-containing protein [Tahibacter amnicola]UXI68031.1 DUF4350 domain-containing protein [Tahibacter amnicola]